MVLSGRYDEFLSFDGNNGYTTFRLVTKKESTIVKSVLINIKLYDEVTVFGNFVDGIFIADRIDKTTRAANEAATAIANGVNGISQKTASKIVAELGVDIDAYIDIPNVEEKLEKIKNLGTEKISRLKEFCTSLRYDNGLHSALVAGGISYPVAISMIQDNPGLTYSDIIKNLYRFTEKYDIDFFAADNMSLSGGLDEWAFSRIEAILKNALRNNEKNGNTYIDKKDFVRKIRSYERKAKTLPIPIELLNIISASSNDIYIEDETLALSDTVQYEKSIKNNLDRISLNKQSLISEEKTDIEIQKQDFEYNEEQKNAIKALSSGGIFIITGGPGTGKTTIVKAIVSAAKTVLNNNDIMLCATTGKAAARLANVTGFTARTIHKALGIKDEETMWNDKSELDKKLIIIDEFSMCDTELFALLLSRIKSGTTVILVGDYNQLPSVGTGQILKDLCDTEYVPVYRLTTIIRQGLKSGIVQNAAQILNGKDISEYEDFKILLCKNDQEIAEEIDKVIAQKNPTQILCPVKKVKNGIFEINDKAQVKSNNNTLSIRINKKTFKLGDKVMFETNDYANGYMNGDIGIITNINNGYISVAMPEDTLVLDVSTIEKITLAYAATVHKYQGSETDDVVIVLPKDSGLLANKKMLYTAITRAKKKVTLITMQQTLDECIKKNANADRKCYLKKFLSE